MTSFETIFTTTKKKPNTTTDFRNLSVWSKMFRLWPNRAVENETRRGAHTHTPSMYWAGCWCCYWTLIYISFSPLPFYLSDAICISHHHRSYCSSHFRITCYFICIFFAIFQFLQFFLTILSNAGTRTWWVCVWVYWGKHVCQHNHHRSSSRISKKRNDNTFYNSSWHIRIIGDRLSSSLS